MISKLGIRREDINRWERRVPLIPGHIRELRESEGLEFLVQPSEIRVFTDDDFRLQGARVEEDLSPCRIVLALKEIPLPLILPGRVYALFSHTAKGQPQNMPMLRRLMELGCTVIDYEKIVDDRGRRLLFFGSYAGHAGMVDTLWALGRRLREEGLKTPFDELLPAHKYGNLVAAKEAVARVGWRIHESGLPPALAPLAVGFLGYGHVSRGAQEVFDFLPFEEIPPRDLPLLAGTKGFSAYRVYKAVFKEEDMVRSRCSGKTFELQDYYQNPGDYEPVVENSIPYLTAVVNGVFWTARYPKFITKAFLRDHYRPGASPRLRVIGDITCDINGSIESTVRATDSENPVYVFEPAADAERPGFAGRGPVVLAVYNLPAELPLEASTFFSSGLKTSVPDLVRADFDVPFENLALPRCLKQAVIVHRGDLAPDYRYLEPLVT